MLRRNDKLHQTAKAVIAHTQKNLRTPEINLSFHCNQNFVYCYHIVQVYHPKIHISKAGK